MHARDDDLEKLRARVEVENGLAQPSKVSEVSVHFQCLEEHHCDVSELHVFEVNIGEVWPLGLAVL